LLGHQSDPILILHASAEVSGIDFSADGRRIAAYIPGNSITIWDTASGEQLLQISGVSELESGIAFTPDGQSVVGSSSVLGATIWNANTGQEVISLLDSSPISSIAFNHDGTYLGTAARDGTATLWDMENGRQTLEFPGQSTRYNFIAFSPDGRQMAMGSEDGTTRLWDLTLSGSAELFTVAAHGGEVYDAVYNSDSTRIASAGEDGTVTIWASATGELIHSLPGRSDGVNFPAFSPDGKRLASANDLGGVTVWDSDSGEELLSLSGDAPAITTVAFSPDGRQLAAGGGREGSANIWDAFSGELLASFSKESGIMRLSYYLDSGHIWSYDCCGNAFDWDANTGASKAYGSITALSTSIDCQDVISDAEESPDGGYWAAAGCGGLVHVFEAQDEPGEDVPIYSKLYALPFHKGSVTGVAFDPEGEVLASVGFDGMTKLWDMKTGLELMTLADQSVALTGVDISPDGRHVVTAASDGTISVYIVSVEELMDVARSRLSRDFTEEECRRYLHLPACLEE
jgi:WD40 repeat protein